MATLTSEIDCSAHTTREINQAIKRAAADGVPEIRLTNPAARHCLAVAVMSPIHVVFDGPVGWYCGGMSDGVRITVNGSCGWSVGENLMSGSIDVHGNGGSSAGATLRGGRVFVAGTTGARSGISMKGGMLVVGGSVGYMSGFMMQRGHDDRVRRRGRRHRRLDVRGHGVRRREHPLARRRLHRGRGHR